MKPRILITLFALLAFAVVSGVVGQGEKEENDRTLDKKQLQRMMEDMLEKRLNDTQPAVDSDNWFLLNESVGIEVGEDRHGLLRGTLYIRRNGGSWRKVAIRGAQELGSDVVPLG
jgi:hypothetical protein